jgi:Winged helix DNA-binding domain
VEEAPRTFTELRALLSEPEPDRDPSALAYLVRMQLPLVQVPPEGAWGTGGSPVHALAESWLGAPLVVPEESLRVLVLRYLAAFGPATVRDIQAWSGLVRLKDQIQELKPELRSLRDENGNELLDLPDAPLPPADAPAPVRFVPDYDNLVLSHVDRTRVISEEHRKKVFLSAARVRATLLVDGFVGGTWKVEKTRKTARLVIEPFESLLKKERDALIEEGGEARPLRRG